MSTSTPLSSLAPDAVASSSSSSSSTGTLHVEADIPLKGAPTEHPAPKVDSYQGYNWAWALIAFIILVIIIWLILWAVKPTWVQQTDPAGNCTGEIDNGKAFLWAVAIALVIVIIVWLIRAAAAAGTVC